jgi:predicted nucleic acid-binding Zn ribbon protein
MQHSEAKREAKHHHHDMSSLDRERKRIRKMRIIFAVFSAALILSLLLSLLLNR